MIWVEIVVGVVGAVVALGTLGSAVRTVIVPRGEQTVLSRFTFLTTRRVFDAAALLRRDPAMREAVKARFAPMALIMLPLVWALGVIFGCAGIFWAMGVRPFRDAVVLSGSSITTLGIRSTDDLPTLTVEILEGLVGLGLIALLISFLPTIYSAFSHRETAVAKLHLRSTGPDGRASAEWLLTRIHEVGALDDIVPMWAEWEDWFVEVEETHTSFPMLVFFRSPVPDRSWITAAGLALDAASLYCSALALPPEPQSQLLIRTGTMSLRRVCDYFGFDYDPDPAPSDPISIERQEFEQVYDRFAAAGLPVVADREQAWCAFAGWRVNYDRPLLSIAEFVEAPPAPWTSDRSVMIHRPTVIRRRR